MMRATSSALAFIALLLGSSAARADPHDPVVAEALFDEGRRLMKEQRYAEACTKLEASQRLDPGVGTLLNLGDCLEHAGRTASAWARFREAASLAAATSQREREQAARERALALEAGLVRIVVRPVGYAANDAGLQITRDGAVVDRETWGIAVPVDPGRHVVRATSPGKIAWSREIDLDEAAPSRTRTVEVPSLEPQREASIWSGQRTTAVIAAGIGFVGLGVGAGFAVDAKTTYDGAERRCTAAGCDAVARERANAAGNAADIATGFFIGGAVALVVGVALFVTAPRHARTWQSLALGIAPTN